MRMPNQTILLPHGDETEIKLSDDLLFIIQYGEETSEIALNSDQARRVGKLLLEWAETRAYEWQLQLTENP